MQTKLLWGCIWLVAGTTLLSAWLLTETSRAQAVIEPIYTLPFYDTYQITTGFTGGVHNGIDYDIGVSGVGGEPIAAATGGIAKPCPISETAGNYIVLDHGNGHRTRYLHLIDEPLPSEGQYVSRGQVIGYEGSTGDSTGPHLHFETRHGATTFTCGFDGTAFDPYGSPSPWTTNPPSYALPSEPAGALAAGDFYGDGWADLAVGVPGEDIGSVKDAGAVQVLYGTSNGLTATSPDDQL